jgi:hypothetical protein
MSSSGLGTGNVVCLGVNGAIFAKAEATTIVIIANNEAAGPCKDHQIYPFKAIVFHGGSAHSVRCVTQPEVDQLRASGTAGQARVVMLKETPAPIASIISCPPPTVVADPISDEAKLAKLTAWLGQDSRTIVAA